MTEFREVLNEWAVRQLTEKSSHAEPFEIIRVRLDHHQGICTDVTYEDDRVDICIEFIHRSCKLIEWNGQPCTVKSWWTSDTRTTVEMLNELLSVADQRE